MRPPLDNAVPTWKHVIYFIIAIIVFGLACVEWAFVYLDTIYLRACYKTPALLAQACSAGAPYHYKSYKPPAGNALVYVCIVLTLVVIIYYVVRGCNYCCKQKARKEIRRESMAM